MTVVQSKGEQLYLELWNRVARPGPIELYWSPTSFEENEFVRQFLYVTGIDKYSKDYVYVTSQINIEGDELRIVDCLIFNFLSKYKDTVSDEVVEELRGLDERYKGYVFRVRCCRCCGHRL